MGGVETHEEESVWSVDLTDEPEGGGGVTGHDQVWFEGIFRTHAPAVHRYFVRRTHVGEVDDLTAETFVVAWRRRADVPDGAELPWLYRTAGFLLANHHRKGRPVPVDRLPRPGGPRRPRPPGRRRRVGAAGADVHVVA